MTNNVFCICHVTGENRYLALSCHATYHQASLEFDLLQSSLPAYTLVEAFKRPKLGCNINPENVVEILQNKHQDNYAIFHHPQYE